MKCEKKERLQVISKFHFCSSEAEIFLFVYLSFIVQSLQCVAFLLKNLLDLGVVYVI